MFWSNLFKKKDKEANINISNSPYSRILSYEELTAEEQEYINKLKVEYLNFYDTEDNYINLDNELFNEIKMYQDLALDIMHNDHFGDIPSSIIDSKKLVYYSYKITEINNTLKYKYIALNELRKDKKYLTKHMGLYVLGRRKINILKALDHQINIINNMFVIADQKITDYCACAIANYPKNIDKSTKKELENRHDEVEKDYKDLFNTSINLDNNLKSTDKITYMEILIDKFIYENKDLINKLKEQIDLIANSELKDKTMQQEIINNLMKIKIYYNIFNKYRKNNLTKEDFEELYQIIFNVHTYFNDVNKFQEYYHKLSAAKDILNSNEINYYDKIISYKLELIKNKKSVIFQRYSEDADKISNAILNYIDEGYEIFAKNQKNSKLKSKNYFIVSKFLNLIISLDYENGLELYFKNLKPIKPDDSFEKLKCDDFLKTYIGIKKYINTHPNVIKQIANKNRTFEEKFILELNHIDENINIKYLAELYNLICKPDLNILPNGWYSKNIATIRLLKYYVFDKNRPIIFPQDNKNLYIDCNDINLTKNLPNIILPEKMVNLDVHVNPNRQIKLKPIVLPVYLERFSIIIYDNHIYISKNHYQKYDEDDIEINTTFLDDVLKIFDKVSKLFIFREEILNKSDTDLYNYLNIFFKEIALTPKWHEVYGSYVHTLIMANLFNYIYLIDKNGNISKININIANEIDISYYRMMINHGLICKAYEQILVEITGILLKHKNDKIKIKQI